MSYLPITMRDIVTPFNISSGESASLVNTASNKASFVRNGGFHFTLTMGIRPYNLRVGEQNKRYWEIVTYLSANPFFKVPLINMYRAPIYDTAPQITVNGEHLPGDNTVSVTSTSEKLYPGTFIRFSNKDKVYQVLSHPSGSNTVTLSHPLAAKVPAGTELIYDEADQFLNDGTMLQGVYGKFLNEDFGNPVNRIEDGIIGNIGPLSLKEKL